MSLTFQRGQQHTVRQDSKSVLEGVQKINQEEAEFQGHARELIVQASEGKAPLHLVEMPCRGRRGSAMSVQMTGAYDRGDIQSRTKS